MIKRSTRIVLGCLLTVFLVSADAFAQISLNPFTDRYTQNFDGLPSSGTGTWVSDTQYFPGWFLNRTIPATTSLLTGTGTNSAGGVYSFGSSGNPDRALGAISSGSDKVGEFAWGLLIQNNTGKTITALNISFTGEQWRSSSTTAPQQTTTFWYATNADAAAFNLSPKSDTGWLNVKELNFSGPVYYSLPGSLDGNAPANKRYLSAILAVNIPSGHYVMLRWKDLNDLYDDHGLAIDDFSMTWTTDAAPGPGIMPVELVSFTAHEQNQEVQLHWATASEKDNSHFIVERSKNGREFTGVASIPGKGTSSVRSDYSFADEQPLTGTAYYRLKQVDFDGTYSFSKVVAVQMRPLTKAILYPTITSDALHLDLPELSQALSIYDPTGRLILHEPVPFQVRKHSLVVSQLKAGSYSLLVYNTKGEKQVLRFVKR